MSQHRILIVVTHLLGSGHLSRALTLARAFVQAGHHAHVVTGGMPAPQLDSKGVEVIQLPALRSDGTDFTRLLGENNALADDALYAAREALLLETLHNVRPDILITELFPFGRRSLRTEFTALLRAADRIQPRPRIYASVRDILAPPSKPRKAVFAADLVSQFYDGVLVHSDPQIVPLSLSWPVDDTLNAKLRYTGFVAPPLPDGPTSDAGHGAVLVSAGGGSVGDTLYAAALDAARGDARHWHILVGGHDAADRIARLKSNAPENVTIEGARPDFRDMLRVADASVSLCGYNTAMDILQTGLPAVMVAFDDGAEVEQTLRAKALTDLPRLETLPLSRVSGAGLRAALDAACGDPNPRQAQFGFGGAAETVRICLRALT